MHVLLIGGNRFVGRLLAGRLLAGGHEVTVLNRGRQPDPLGDRVGRITCDRTDAGFERAVGDRRFDAVVDLAAYTGDDGRRAAALFHGRTRHYVLISTGQVYLVREGQPRPMARAAREEDYEGPVMARPHDPAELRDWEYGVGKRDCEDALAAAAREGFPATRLRIPMVNGPLDFFRRIEGYLWRLADGGPVLLPGGGAHRVRHVDGGEVARFVAGILLREDTYGRAFNLAQEETPTLAELVGALRDRLGSAARVVDVPADALSAAGLALKDVSPFHDPWMSFLDPSRARDELGFRHAPLAESLATIVSAFLSNPPADRPAGYAGRDRERALAPARTKRAEPPAPRRRPHSADQFGDQRDLWWNADYLRLLAARLELGTVRLALDVGCGVGHWGRLLLPHLAPGARLVGVDPEPAWVAEATARAAAAGIGARVEYRDGRAERLPFPDASFDLVTCQTVLMHVPDPAAALREMARVVRPGGLVVAAEPSNLASALLLGATRAREDATQLVDELRLQLVCERGKAALGEGCSSLGPQLPAHLAAAGLEEVRAWQWDRAAVLLPPYGTREQQVLVADELERAREGVWIAPRDEMLRWFVAGGGDEAEFARLWERALAGARRLAAAFEAGEERGISAGVAFVVAGRRPGSPGASPRA